MTQRIIQPPRTRRELLIDERHDDVRAQMI